MFETEIQDSAARWDVPESWVRAVIDVESSWNPDAINPADPSYGLMQILDRTARGLGFTGAIPEQLMDPATNIDLGTKLLGQLRRRYGDDFRRIYSAYNSGRPDLWEVSSQVGRNVDRALAALDKYAEPIAYGALLALVVLVIVAATRGG